MERSIHAAIALSILYFSTQIISISAAPSLTRSTITTLSSHASTNQVDPKKQAQDALNEALKATKSASEELTKLSKLKTLTPREAAAIADCVEVIGDAVDELQDSVGELGRVKGGPSDLALSNVKTWVSAALTNDDTCSDGFSDIEGGIKKTVTDNITKVEKLTSNALALINKIA